MQQRAALYPGGTRGIAGLHHSPVGGGNDNQGAGATREGELMLGVFGLRKQGAEECERHLRRFALGPGPNWPISQQIVTCYLAFAV